MSGDGRAAGHATSLESSLKSFDVDFWGTVCTVIYFLLFNWELWLSDNDGADQWIRSLVPIIPIWALPRKEEIKIINIIKKRKEVTIGT